jgi:hypothetical protein
MILSTILGLVVVAPTAAQTTVDIAPTAITNGMSFAQPTFEMKNLGGKKLHPTKWIDKVEVGGVVIPDTDYAAGRDGGTAGDVAIIKPGIPPGKRKVKITVILNDGTKVTGEKDVGSGKIFGQT